MTVPQCARSVAAVIGGLLVLAAWSSAVETLIVPRPEAAAIMLTVLEPGWGSRSPGTGC